MAKLSLQEQLLKSGLVSDAKAKQIKSEKQKQVRLQQKNNQAAVDETAVLAQTAQALKLQKDRELNKQKQADLDKKSIVAQIQQLVSLNKLALDREGVAYHFNAGGKVETLYVSEHMREQLSKGQLAITQFEQQFEVITLPIAEKIREREPDYFMLINTPESGVADDVYAAYVVPDDLIW